MEVMFLKVESSSHHEDTSQLWCLHASFIKEEPQAVITFGYSWRGRIDKIGYDSCKCRIFSRVGYRPVVIMTTHTSCDVCAPFMEVFRQPITHRIVVNPDSGKLLK